MAKGRIPQSDIEAIRERAPIEEIVGEYVQLKPAGHDSLKGLSPFKDERTPSFHVRPARGYYHCFSTDKGGDVFSFLMEVEQLSFPEAVEAVADKIGYHIRYEGGSTGGRNYEPGTRKRLLAANKAAHEYYRAQLETPEAEKARNLLLDRGFSPELIHHFECGYAPQGWEHLTKHLLRKGFSQKELETAGLSTITSRGTYIDQFRGRLLWPIKDVTGNVIGFGARKLYDDDPAGKYMNTRETMLYNKSKVLFGLHEAKKHIAREHQAVVVEGYTDVMAMHAAGVKTAVASSGTAFGTEHLQVLRRHMLDDNYFRGELIYVFDGDEAGQKAALRAFEGDQNFTGQSFVAVAPEGLDPCDLRMEKGDVALRDLVAARIPMFEFVITSLLNEYRTDTAEGRLQALRRTIPVVAGVRDEVLRTDYARQLAGWVGWSDPDDILRQVREEVAKPKKDTRRLPRATRFDDATTRPADENPMVIPPNPRDPRLWPEREAIKLALQEPQVAGSYFDGLADDAFTNSAYQAIRDAIAKAGGLENAGDGGVDWIAAVAGEMLDYSGRNFVSELAVEEIRSDKPLEEYADTVLCRLQEQLVGNQIALLKAQLQRMRPTENQEAYNSLFSDIVALEQARRELNDRAFR
ncbi:DNA primase [Corynebacterium yudongzhengii]|uniref:DNA primase n=1 Tax=Corynebacterium yudongzhengii TaxID=2080740 RepID=A0A2U1T7H2_9CORY|nr:DNA primase [Corynebacterium yudongzhengii]AWB81482.1 DNA primase [Corynebacterium yudongzhengii]PWC01947.1 DNA primase [Corynebacterium yudongzhengii]